MNNSVNEENKNFIPNKDFANAIGFITDLIKDVIAENKKLSIDVSALTIQFHEMKSSVEKLNNAIYEGSIGKDSILIRLNHIENFEKQTGDDLKDISSNLKEIRISKEDVERLEKVNKNKLKIIDRDNLWKIISIIVATFLTFLTTQNVIQDNFLNDVEKMIELKIEKQKE